jgi:UDP-N-acetylglucosamine--N-acetylmuramyl-(pentapeptide) pyrophosphoryl-undecaprenol N-acetylglucosamine transferase
VMSRAEVLGRDAELPRCEIVFQAINSVGLGHISRLTAIASALREASPTTKVALVADGGDHGILAGSNVPLLAAPPYPQDDAPVSAWEPWSVGERQWLATRIAESLLDHLQPRLVVFDTFPNIAFWTAAADRRIPYAVVLRKMKGDTTFTTTRSLLRHAVSILLPHDRGELVVPADLAPKTVFVGSIVRAPRFDPSRPEASPIDVLITGGGGGFRGTTEFYQAAIAAFARWRSRQPRLTGLLVMGPLFGDATALVPTPGLVVVHAIADLSRLFADAGVVVCQAGYNTMAELAAIGVRTICVPAPRVLDDQRSRAEALAAVHPWIKVCAACSAEDLDAAYAALLAGPSPERGDAPTGAATAASHLLGLLARPSLG